ncbi:HAD family hydrolase [Sphingosinicella ginsenosidimutans]|uniref:Phosphoglycolate phosphatase n=1 Tax=Allosphingosinicella ginsenosidimutans TaxID=1176539 RepID=A0A5C6TV41_9SPHN|nr:phosphoglycolate phosphatase [Sphingosinicella ginsenosidimutans]TXC64099.1 phosphoglycolate phosphatase [Sphingosinicella ginsenosidimutans]
MARIPFDIVLFDLDGTLVDSSGDLAASLNHVLKAMGRPVVDLETVKRLVGRGGRVLIREGLALSGESSEALVDEGYPIFLEHYAAHICDHTRPYPGVEAALDALVAAGASLAICTNKPERLTHLLIDALGWRGRFGAIVGADTLAVRKPDPAPAREAIARAGGGRAVFIGDSITDAETARAAGLPFVAVSFGFADRPAEALGADAVIDRYAALAETLAAL